MVRVVHAGNIQPWEQVGESVIRVESRFGTVYEEQWRNPVSGQNYIFPLQFKIGNYVSILPLTRDGNLVIINQWKQGVKMLCPQFPGGAMGDECDVATAVREKLLSETGYQAGEIEIVPTKFQFFDTRCPNWYKVVLALGCGYVGRPSNASTDVIQVLEITPAEFWQMIENEDIHEPAAYVSALLAVRRGLIPL